MLRVMSFAVGWALVGCGGEDFFPDGGTPPDDTGTGEPVEDRILQAPTAQVDVLFVIDNSGSMADDQKALATELPRFVARLDEWGVDYQVGITTTDTEHPDLRGTLVAANGARFVTPALADPVGTLAEMAQVGTEGAPTERGILAAYLVLESQRNQDANRGFQRPGVPLSTVVVSDEDDETDTIVTVGEFASWYRALRDSPADRTFSAIVAFESVGQSQRGSRYLTLADTIGGAVWDIDRGNWSAVLDELGLQTAGLRRDFALGQIPQPGTIEVEIERPLGNEVQIVEVQGFRYSTSRNAVTLDVVPEAQDVVVIRYLAL